MSAQRGLVIGTAGHIDHGKTSLVRALTGIDTDRLEEEKRRGISIDLGFAHLLLNGRCISFVDVPGHERFVKNMLAGAGGIQAALLVIAADESVKPQTREHFDICRLLGIEQGIVVLTKVDLVSPEQLRAACEDATALCAGSFLAGAPMVPVSATTGRGIAELKHAISSLADRIQPRDDTGLARLPIDRSFALKGFGTVVTGTLWNGRLRTGEAVQIQPSKNAARIRGLQVHGNQVSVANAGQRTAVNLTGVEASEIQRGCVLTHDDGLEATELMDASVDWLDESEIPRTRERYLLHLGTGEAVAALKVLQRAADSRTFARLFLFEPLLALPGDRFVLRKLSPARTIAGGSVIDAFPLRRLNRTKTIERLNALAYADADTRLQSLIEESSTGQRLQDLVRLTGIQTERVKALIAGNPRLVYSDSAQRALSKAWIERRRQRLIDWLKEFHAKHPSTPGAPIALARLGLEPGLAAIVFENSPAIRVNGDVVSLATHDARFSDRESQALLKIEYAFRQAGFTPPPMSDVLKTAGTDLKKARELLEALIKREKLVRISEDLIFHADVISHIRKSLSAHKGRKFSVPEFKTWTQISRKYAIPLLEYLDRQHVTKREGDNRIIL
jgi:selenocysteine-specific elongation factor